jgi:hypothetical protein
MNTTNKEGRIYWHVQIFEEDGKPILVRKKGQTRVSRFGAMHKRNFNGSRRPGLVEGSAKRACQKRRSIRRVEARQ